MFDRVTVVPEDKLVIVGTTPLNFDYEADNNVHAIQWLNGEGEIEYRDYTPNLKFGKKDYDKYVKPYVQLYDAEKARLDKEEAKRVAEYNSEEARFARLREERDKRIAATDYLLAADYPISSDKLEAVKQYRQALRDLPSLAGAPWTDDSIPWPTNPMK